MHTNSMATMMNQGCQRLLEADRTLDTYKRIFCREAVPWSIRERMKDGSAFSVSFSVGADFSDECVLGSRMFTLTPRRLRPDRCGFSVVDDWLVAESQIDAAHDGGVGSQEGIGTAEDPK